MTDNIRPHTGIFTITVVNQSGSCDFEWEGYAETIADAFRKALKSREYEEEEAET